MYEHFVVSLSTSVTQFHAEVGLKEDVTYCMVALEHLRVCHCFTLHAAIFLEYSNLLVIVCFILE